MRIRKRCCKILNRHLWRGQDLPRPWHSFPHSHPSIRPAIVQIVSSDCTTIVGQICLPIVPPRSLATVARRFATVATTVARKKLAAARRDRLVQDAATKAWNVATASLSVLAGEGLRYMGLCRPMRLPQVPAEHKSYRLRRQRV